jgi:hypothetical protein
MVANPATVKDQLAGLPIGPVEVRQVPAAPAAVKPAAATVPPKHAPKKAAKKKATNPNLPRKPAPGAAAP